LKESAIKIIDVTRSIIVNQLQNVR